MSIGKEKQDFKIFLKDYTVQSLRPLLTHINREVKISGIRLMKKDIIIEKISELYSSNRKLSNGVIILSPKSINVSNINLDVIKQKVQKEVIKKKVIKEVVKDVVKQATKKGIKPTKKEKVIIEKKVKDVVEKKKPAPNKKIKEHINKVEKKIIKKKKLTKKELEEIESKKKSVEATIINKLRKEGGELLEKNKGLLEATPTKMTYPGASKNKYVYLLSMLESVDGWFGEKTIRSYNEMIKYLKEEILEIKKVEKKVIKKKKLTKKELEEIEREKKYVENAKADKLRMEGEELLQKNKGLLKSIPTNRNYPGGSQNRFQALWNLLNGMSSSSDFTGMLKRIKEEILKIKKDKLKKMIKK